MVAGWLLSPWNCHGKSKSSTMGGTGITMAIVHAIAVGAAGAYMKCRRKRPEKSPGEARRGEVKIDEN